jgi:PDZ domain-containing protein
MKLFRPARLLTAGLVLLAVVLALWIVPSDQYIFLPDKAHPVAPLVTVQGGHDPPGPGGIYFVDVIVRKASLLERLLGGLHDGAELRPRDQVVPPGINDAQRRQLDLGEMSRSQRVAAAVALRAMGRKVVASPTGALIATVQDNRPADGKLRPGDVIVAVDGKRVRSPLQVSRRMGEHKAGDTVRFTVRRDTGRKVIPLETVRAADGSNRPIVGVLLEPNYDIGLPTRVRIDAGNVGGPSAGVAFALEVMEKLGRDVDHGHRVAATGEIFLDGRVGPVGGLEQKTIGARRSGVEAFLVPAGENAREARKYAKGLRVIPVRTFPQALRALATLPREQEK